MRVTQILNSRDLLPRTCGLQSMSVNRDSCACSWSELRLPLRAGTQRFLHDSHRPGRMGQHAPHPCSSVRRLVRGVLALFVPMLRLQPGLASASGGLLWPFLCRLQKKAAVASSSNTSRRPRSGCATNRPALLASCLIFFFSCCNNRVQVRRASNILHMTGLHSA